MNSPSAPLTGPEGIVTANGVRYLISVCGDHDDGWDWTVESLPADYACCDGLCIYGCGARPWTVLADGIAYTKDEALSNANDARTWVIGEAAKA
jgi:hypothetical protein